MTPPGLAQLTRSMMPLASDHTSACATMEREASRGMAAEANTSGRREGL